MQGRRQWLGGALAACLGSSWADESEEKKDGVQPGQPAPQPLGVGPDGDGLRVEQFKGKVLVVSFWASWCGPCLKELPILDNVARKLGDRVSVVSINIEDRDTYRAIRRRLGDKLALTLSHDRNGGVFPIWGKGGIPYLLIINQQGVVHARYRGYGESTLDEIVADLNTLLTPKG